MNPAANASSRLTGAHPPNALPLLSDQLAQQLHHAATQDWCVCTEAQKHTKLQASRSDSSGGEGEASQRLSKGGYGTASQHGKVKSQGREGPAALVRSAASVQNQRLPPPAPQSWSICSGCSSSLAAPSLMSSSSSNSC